MIYNRRSFIKLSTLSLATLPNLSVGQERPFNLHDVPKGLRIGIIGLDVSHSVAFTKILNIGDASPEFRGYKVVAAYPMGSNNIPISSRRIPEFTTAVSSMGVEIVNSIENLLTKVDAVMLNTNDGRMHLEQIDLVFKSGKPVFINKPMAASLAEVKAIMDLSEKYKVPFFSSSSMRYIENIDEIVSIKAGRILGADTYSPATIEKSHVDLFWYGVHGVEMLFTLLGKGCMEVRRIHTLNTDIVTGIWTGDRIGTFRGTRSGVHGYGGNVFCEKQIISVAPPKGFQGLVRAIVDFFHTGISPVSPDETLEIYAFMHAADESKKKNGAPISIKIRSSN